MTKYNYLFLILLSFFISCIEKDQESHFQNNTVLNPTLKEKPNILWLVAEDLSPVIPAYGDSTIKTPNLDRLSSEGVVYDHFYSPHPVCAPARASIITGMYANHIGASHMRTGPWGKLKPTEKDISVYDARMPEGVKSYEAIPPKEVRMFTEYLRAHGYYCTNNSKTDYQFLQTPTAWDDFGKNASWRNRPEHAPFFSVINFNVTHESQIWARKNKELRMDSTAQVPIPPYLPDTEIAKQDIRRMYSNIVEMDAQVGEVLDDLEKDGLLDNTVIFWYSDHGGPLPRQKRLIHDSGLKVPMIIRFPNAQFKGKRDKRLISFIDLAPTMLSLADIKTPVYMEGAAFLGNHIRKEEPKYTFGAGDRFDEIPDRIRTVKDKRYRYIRYYEPEKPMFMDIIYRNQMPIMQELKKLRDEDKLSPQQALWFRAKKPKEELFDTKTDPHEVINLAENPEYADKLDELSKACDNWVRSSFDTGMIAESELYKKFRPIGEQPVTQIPIISIENTKVSITCKTEGASIGFKIIDMASPDSNIAWHVYTQPFELPENAKVEAIAHRIGYKRSEIVLIEE